ncbi:MAG: hypothetical protein KJZ93_18375 [Caldilineaceae bacterium]|nr:hypothetical protein [Caldilineaceae bacterium]
MNRATRITVSAFGVLTGLAGIEHGVGEILQGNSTPAGIMILSWPDSTFFRILGGEPAMTIVPNMMVTGMLAILSSLCFLVWATLWVERKNAGPVLMLLSIVMLLVGAGIGPPVLGVILGLAATRIHAPLTWWRTHLPAGLRRGLGQLWPWSLGAGLIAWLAMLPGTGILAYFFGVENPTLVYALVLCMFGLLFLTILTGFARDSLRQPISVSGAYRGGISHALPR